MAAPILDYRTPGVENSHALLTPVGKCFLIAFGVVLPLACFAVAARQYPTEPEWQSGEWDRYIRFIPDGRAGYPFYPLLAYCMSSLCFFVVRPSLSGLLIVRLGLYTGIVMAVQYTLIQATAFESSFVIALFIGLASNLILLGVLKMLETIPPRILLFLAIAIGAGLTATTLLIFERGGMGAFMAGRTLQIPFMAGLIAVVFAPAWCVGTFVKATLVALRCREEAGEKQSPMWALFAWIPWLFGYVVAWKWSIANAIVLYAALPTHSPSCYVATAAASGHAKFVGSALARAEDGSTYPVNMQLRRLKCVEIAIADVYPSGHRLIRRIYDTVGPPLARLIALRPVVADIAFVALKPIEWLSFGVLIAVVPEARRAMRRLYPPAIPKSESPPAYLISMDEAAWRPLA